MIINRIKSNQNEWIELKFGTLIKIYLFFA
jgi:hypothetical protein